MLNFFKNSSCFLKWKIVFKSQASRLEYFGRNSKLENLNIIELFKILYVKKKKSLFLIYFE